MAPERESGTRDGRSKQRPHERESGGEWQVTSKAKASRPPQRQPGQAQGGANRQGNNDAWLGRESGTRDGRSKQRPYERETSGE